MNLSVGKEPVEECLLPLVRMSIVRNYLILKFFLQMLSTGLESDAASLELP